MTLKEAMETYRAAKLMASEMTSTERRIFMEKFEKERKIIEEAIKKNTNVDWTLTGRIKNR